MVSTANHFMQYYMNFKSSVYKSLYLVLWRRLVRVDNECGEVLVNRPHAQLHVKRFIQSKSVNNINSFVLSPIFKQLAIGDQAFLICGFCAGRNSLVSNEFSHRHVAI